MKILIISYSFSPKISIASYRIDAFAKYLSEAGHSVTVVASGDSDRCEAWNGCTVHYLRNRFDYCDPRDSRIVRRFKYLLAGALYCLTLDGQFLWRQRAFERAERLFSEGGFDVLLTTYGPLSPHSIALKLRRKGYKFHWIADMRDEMSNHPVIISRKMAGRFRSVERRILREADLVTTVSRPLLEDFRKLCGHDRFLEIRNGYDYEEIRDVSFQPQFTLAYIGKFYGVIRPDRFFEVLVRMKAAGELPEDFRFRIVGNGMPLRVPEPIRANVEQLAAVPHDRAIGMSLEADVLVMIHPTGRKGVYSGKVFDYLATNKPILALYDPRDVVAELLVETGAGFVVDNDDPEGIRLKLLECLRIWRNREVLPRNWEKIRQYTRRAQTGLLNRYLARLEADGAQEPRLRADEDRG
ncbi:MAG: glycosyltransferase [Alistipes sp.]|nr:glycosyltransferase [Alistipes sp.]